MSPPVTGRCRFRVSHERRCRGRTAAVREVSRASRVRPAPVQVAFLRDTGNPLAVELRKTFTEIAPPTRLAYRSLIDFVPGQEPYEHLTTIDIEPAGDRAT